MSIFSQKEKYYSLKKILSLDCEYNVIYGKRSSGKTYAFLVYAVEQYWKDRQSEFAYIRRWDSDIKQPKMRSLFSALVKNHEIERITGGKYNGVTFYSGQFFMVNTEDDTIEKLKIGECFALNTWESNKGGAYPYIRNICLDEFISRNGYIGGMTDSSSEFSIFMNVLSTIIRDRTDCRVFLLGNSIELYNNPYINEMGLKKVKKQAMGTIDVYKYGDGKDAMKVAVEYTHDTSNTSKTNKKYFAFDNPALSVITSGGWTIDIYPHLGLDERIKDRDIVQRFYLYFDEEWVAMDYVISETSEFVYVHPQTKPVDMFDENNIVFTFEGYTNPNIVRSLYHSPYPSVKRLRMLFEMNKFIYSSNIMGEIIRSWTIASSQL